ncbi:RidA family protein [Umezawaea sp. Da 62-37]|uniref:RidA family protein n=1 Tax=Umezawaea sp. Da 62-37 TaxID=3075927 RepID=UPI0028F6E7A8|nr:RidA family protein [Umezawaea sp. Da 62-37]WNV85566.1 RidA family protein [Umezawaea sp. Da 62-37]
MAVDRLDPATLASPVMNLYSQVAIASPGSRLVAIAGQVALDARGALVGEGDLGAQAEQAFRNLRAGLEAAGGTPADLLKYTIHVVDSDPSMIGPVFEAARRAFDGELPLVPSTWLGVAALGLPEWLIEVDGLASVD